MVFLSFSTLRQLALVEVLKLAKPEPKQFWRTRYNYNFITRSYGTCVDLKDLKEQWLKRLQKHNIPEAELSLKYIMEHVLCINGRDFKVRVNRVMR